MERRERMRGRCALLAIAGLTLATGCGNSASELLQPLSAMRVVGGVGHGDASIRQAGEPARASADHTAAPKRERTGEAKPQPTDTNATSGRTPRPDRPSDAADREQPASAHPPGRPGEGLQTNKDREKGASVEPQSGRGPTAHPAPCGPGRGSKQRPGPWPSSRAKGTNAKEAEKGTE